MVAGRGKTVLFQSDILRYFIKLSLSDRSHAEVIHDLDDI